MNQNDKNHNPRKGTETKASAALAVMSSGGDKNHNPRKGTETMARSTTTSWRLY